MANLIEVIFESVSKSCVMQLLSRLIGGWENVVNIECTESLTLFNESQLGEGGLKQFMDFDGEATALINISSINLERVILRNVQLRLIKYDEQYDIEFNFNSDELGNTTTKALIKELHAHATRIAFECEVSNFYCGMEPASDEDTRYFTNGELGPLAA